MTGVQGSSEMKRREEEEEDGGVNPAVAIGSYLSDERGSAAFSEHRIATSVY